MRPIVELLSQNVGGIISSNVSQSMSLQKVSGKDVMVKPESTTPSR